MCRFRVNDRKEADHRRSQSLGQMQPRRPGLSLVEQGRSDSLQLGQASGSAASTTNIAWSREADEFLAPTPSRRSAEVPDVEIVSAVRLLNVTEEPSRTSCVVGPPQKLLTQPKDCYKVAIIRLL